MLRILTFNANGIRSAAKKGFFEWFKKQNADILCIQELKAQEADLSDELKARFLPLCAEKGVFRLRSLVKESPGPRSHWFWR